MGGKAPSKHAADVSLVIERALAPHIVHTLTVDRGHEFALGPALQKSLGAPIYFCKARCPWQRGTNENTNGLLREYFPKRTPLDDISPTRIQQVYDQLNQRPRKRLGWKPLRKPTHTARCTSYEKPSLKPAIATISMPSLEAWGRAASQVLKTWLGIGPGPCPADARDHCDLGRASSPR